MTSPSPLLWQRCAFAVVLLLAAAPGASAAEPQLSVPVDCDFNTLCSIQKYVDHDAGDGFRDHTCGTLTSPDHNGIDFRVPTLRDMEGDGVAVIAAAPGTVLRLRDGMEDVSVKEVGREAVRGREAGNAVIIDHGDGWTTQYSHLRKGSVDVRKGQQVETGERLGLIGMSGLTQFPHLHFTLRHNGQVVDPYTGLAPDSGCGRFERSFWSAEAAETLAYTPGGLIDAGFAAEEPSIDQVIANAYGDDQLPGDAPVLLFWAVTWGAEAGDREEMRLFGPDGSLFADYRGEVESNKAQRIRYVGKRLRSGRWQNGTYRGEYRVLRGDPGNDEVVVSVEREMTVQ